MISDIDIKDWIPTEQPVKLYEVPRETVIQIPGVPDLLMFHRLDGMYSLCSMFTGENKGQTAHIAAFVEVLPWQKVTATTS